MLVEDIRVARRSKGLTQQDVADRCDLTRQAIKRIEAGIGSVANLYAVMAAVEFHLVGIGSGHTLGDQLRARRIKRDWSIERVAKRSGLSRATIASLEGNGGTVASLQKLIDAVAPGAKRRAPERAYWGQGKKTERDVRFTPPNFLERIVAVFGDIDLDPCGHRDSPVVSRRRFLLEDGDDGLRDNWSGRFVFVNPPFSNLLVWLRRAHQHWSAGNVETVVCLSPVRTDSAWFHEALEGGAEVYLLKGRLRFLKLDGTNQNTPYSLMLFTLGTTPEQRSMLKYELDGSWM